MLAQLIPLLRSRLCLGFFLTSLLPLLPTSAVFAQQRPLTTPDAEILPAGSMRAEVGFDFLQDVEYPASGLTGDLTSVGVIRIRTAVGRNVEIQMEGAVQHFLSVSRQVAGPIPPSLTGPDTTHDVGDFSFFTKVRLFGEAERRPALAFRFGYQMPNSNQARGIGLNTMNLFAELILQKHFRKLNVFGSAGLAILQAPTAAFTQNDVLTYGLGITYPFSERVTLVGEVAGRHSTRDISPQLIGTESRSHARFGMQILAGGFTWDLAGIKGLTRRDANAGFTFGVSKQVRLFEYDKRP